MQPRLPSQDPNEREVEADRNEGVRPTRRSLIVDRAADVFFEKGYDGASIQDVADAVGILKGSLYHHIDSKQDLLLDIVRQVQEGLLSVVLSLEQDTQPTERLRGMIVGHVGFIERHRTKVGVCSRDLRALGPDRLQVVEADQQRYEQVFFDLIVDAQGRNEFRADLDAEVATKGVLGMLSLVPAWFDAQGRLSAQQVGEHLATLVLGGLARRAD